MNNDTKITIYQISVSGFGTNNVGTTVLPLNTFQGSRRHCFKKLRKLLTKSVVKGNLESACFHKIVYDVHIGRFIDNMSDLKGFKFKATDILNWRRIKDE